MPGFCKIKKTSGFGQVMGCIQCLLWVLSLSFAVLQMCVRVELGHTLCASLHKTHFKDTQQTMYLVITSPELILTDELSLVDKPSSVALQGRAKGYSSAGT